MTAPKLTLRELIARVDLSRQPTNASAVLGEFGIDAHDFDHAGFDARAKEYWLAPWCCTDTWVGLSVLVVDGTAVAVAMQNARRDHKRYAWLTTELRTWTRDLALSFARRPAEHFTLANLDEELESHYHVHYGEQLVVDDVLYQGQSAKVVTRSFGYNDPNWGKVTIALADGHQVTVPAAELKLPYWITA